MARLEEGSSVSVLTEPPAREPLDVKFVRNVLNHWPFSRGKGVVL